MITTTIAPQRAATDRTVRARWTVPAALGLGVLGGAVLGVVARLWMRLISTEPEFTWSGTLFIVVAFALFAFGQAVSWSARRTSRRRRRVTAARTAGVVLSLAIFGGAGSLMLPTVLAGALAAWRTDWTRAVRVVVAIAAVPIAGFLAKEIVGDLGWGVHGLTGVALFVALYGVVIVALGPTVAPVADGWRMSRRVRIALTVAPVGLGALFVTAALLGV